MKTSLDLPDVRCLDTNSIEYKIVRTIEHTGIDLDRAILVGSAALILYGVELQSRIDDIETSRPHDVDLSVDVTAFLQQCDKEQSRLRDTSDTPSSLEITRDLNKTLLSLKQTDANLLPVDIITNYQGAGNKKSIQRYNAQFAKNRLKHSVELPGSDGVRIITPKKLEAQLRKHSSQDDKYDRDLWSFYEARTTRR